MASVIAKAFPLDCRGKLWFIHTEPLFNMSIPRKPFSWRPMLFATPLKGGILNTGQTGL